MSTTDAVLDLRRALLGAVIEPGDAEYDAARRPVQRPDRSPTCGDRALCRRGRRRLGLDFARSNGLEVAVRGGGHNPAGHCVVDDGIVIDLSQMRSVEVDADARIARADGGSTWLDFDTATQSFGLVTPGEVVGSTGVAGLTLSGGIGHLTSQHGLTCDNLVRARSSLRRRGGRGRRRAALGAARRRRQLRRRHAIRLPAAPARRPGRGSSPSAEAACARGCSFREIVAQSPSGLSCQAGLGLDESMAPSLWIAPSYTGSSSDPEEQGFARPRASSPTACVPRRSWTSSGSSTTRATALSVTTGRATSCTSFDELIDVLIERVAAPGKPIGGILIESLHGAPKEVDGTSALGWRRAAFNVSAMATWQNAALDDEAIQWARETAAAVEPWSLGAGYANYATGDEPIERVRAGFGDEAFERLQALKRRYDPENAPQPEHSSGVMELPPVVSEAEWQAALEALRGKEKDATRARDALAAERRRLPRVRIDKDYVFEGPNGPARLPDVFEGRRQLIVYHFMFGPNQEVGCDGCSMFVDQIGHLAHLHARDVSFALISRAPIDKIERYRRRMDWAIRVVLVLRERLQRRLRPLARDSAGGRVPGRRDLRPERLRPRRRRGLPDVLHEPARPRGARQRVWTLDLTPLGRQEDWEDSPEGYPQGPPYDWWRRHDSISVGEPRFPHGPSLRTSAPVLAWTEPAQRLLPSSLLCVCEPPAGQARLRR